jgi:imidazolonepropionase
MLQRVAQAGMFGVMLPASGFHVDDRYANARAFLDAGGKLVLATNCNPGSSPTSSMPFVIALAVRKLRLSAAEAIVATTSRAADLLGLPDRGRIEVGKRADLVLLRHRDERLLAYELGGNPVKTVICGGERIS